MDDIDDMSAFIQRCAYLQGFFEGAIFRAKENGELEVCIPEDLVREAEEMNSALLTKLIRKTESIRG